MAACFQPALFRSLAAVIVQSQVLGNGPIRCLKCYPIAKLSTLQTLRIRTLFTNSQGMLRILDSGIKSGLSTTKVYMMKAVVATEIDSSFTVIY
jgi:hypothetical protein